MLLLILVVLTAASQPPRCVQYCRYIFSSQSVEWDPQCDCSTLLTETLLPQSYINSATVSNPYENRGVYTVKRVSYLDQLYYILNPSTNINRTPQKEPKGLSNKNYESMDIFDGKAIERKKVPSAMNTERNTLSYINADERKIKLRSERKLLNNPKESHQPEVNLSECVNQHLSAIAQNQQWATSKFKNLQNLSHENLIEAVKNECKQVAELSRGNLNKITNFTTRKQDSQHFQKPGHRNWYIDDKSVEMGKNDFLMKPLDVKLPLTNLNKSEPKFTYNNTNITKNLVEKKIKEHDIFLDLKHFDNTTNDGVNNSTTLSTTVKATNISRTVPDLHFTKINTLPNITETLEYNNDNNNSSRRHKNESNPVNNQRSYNIEKSVTNKEDKSTEHSGAYNETEISTKSYLYHETIRENINPVKILQNRSMKDGVYFSITPPLDSEEPVTSTIANRKVYNENEIPLQKIITKEYSNGTLLSVVDSTEALPNNDFSFEYVDNTQSTELFTNNYNDNDNTSHDYESYITQMPTTEHYKSAQEILDHDGIIIGKLYFVFDQEHIPAKFIQRPNGEIHVGIDGPTLCYKLHKNDD
ncbi:putative uncharacterized protein DDB_G0285119 [Battus philenor]|uniref:putative uncharacterized protein DDB_G0285119 n=1 Tax=Battus philenor TaxID=42288 RepID=UPI0035CE88A2